MSVVAFSSPAKQINGPQGSELAVAGALLKEPALIGTLAARLCPEDFSHSFCRTVFEVAMECHESSLPCDAGLFAEKIREKTKSIDPVFFRNAQALPVAVCMEHAKRVKIFSLLRSFKTEATELLKNPSAENIIRVSNILAELSGARSNAPARVSSVAEQVVESLKSPLEGISYGFADLDSWTGGMKPGEFIVLAGRPSMGKS
ncbi:MAG: DnaB-like helicase N-terminal domain-containing protein, partial [Desulfotomaculales bacterium]